MVRCLGPGSLMRAIRLNHVSDGSVHGDLPCDPYSRLLYLGRGLRPGIAVDATPPSLQCHSLQDAIVELMDDMESWDGTATELLSTLNGSVDGIFGDATRHRQRDQCKPNS